MNYLYEFYNLLSASSNYASQSPSATFFLYVDVTEHLHVRLTFKYHLRQSLNSLRSHHSPNFQRDLHAVRMFQSCLNFKHGRIHVQVQVSLLFDVNDARM